MNHVYIEIFRCCLTTGFSERVILEDQYDNTGALFRPAEVRLRDKLCAWESTLMFKYKASVKRVLKGKAQGVKLFYSEENGKRYYLFIKWYEQSHHIQRTGSIPL